MVKRILPFDVIRAPNSCLIFLSNVCLLRPSLFKNDFLGETLAFKSLPLVTADSFKEPTAPPCGEGSGDTGLEPARNRVEREGLKNEKK